MNAVEKLRQRLLKQVPEAPDEPPPEDEPAAPVQKVTVSALGGRHTVEVYETVFARLVGQAGGVIGPDLTQADLGKLINAAKDSGPRHLLDLLVQVRDSTTPVYCVRLEGRPWRLGGINQNIVPTGFGP